MIIHEPVRQAEFVRRSVKRFFKIGLLFAAAVCFSGFLDPPAARGESSPSNPEAGKNPSAIIVDSLILPFSFKLSVESARFFPEKDSGAKAKLVVNTREPIPSLRLAARATVIDAGAASVFGPAEFQNDGFNTYSFRWGGKDRRGRYVAEGPYQMSIEVRCDSSMVFMSYPVQALYEKDGAGDPGGCGKGFYLALLVPMIVRMGKRRR
jgi:hypothetical protein